MRRESLRHEFVEFIPPTQEEGVLYISVEYATAVHRCFCGCGEKVVTPLSPTDWTLTFDGRTVSLSPSIGNWGYNCRSHYVIRKDRVRWAGAWSPERVAAGRHADRAAKRRQFGEEARSPVPADRDTPGERARGASRTSGAVAWFRRLRRRVRRGARRSSWVG